MPCRGPARSVDDDLDQGDALCFQPLFAINHLDPDPLTRVEGADAAAAQRGDVDEHVLAPAVGRDEPIAFFSLEPFDGTLDRRGRAGPAVGSNRSAWRR